MIGADDVMDNAHWANIQDPVKQMFMSITKAIRTQSAGIRDLDKKCDSFVAYDMATRMIQDQVNMCCTKQDATQLIYQIDTKASEKDFAVLESRIVQAFQQIDKLQDTVQSQAVSISDIHTRLDLISVDIHQLKNPNYDQIFGYIDRQINNLAADTDRKLAVKADQREMETCIPQRLEDLYRSMNTKLNDMQVDIARSATKEDFQILANNKANGSDIRELAHELSDRVTRHELQQAVSGQVNPLVSALSSLEKAIHIQDVTAKHNQSALADKTQSLEKMYREHVEYRLTSAKQLEDNMNRERVERIVEDVIRDKRLNEVTPSTVENQIATQTEYLLRQMGILGESIRLEVVTNSREEFSSVQHSMAAKIAEVTALTKELGDKYHHTKVAIHDIKDQCAASLSRKLDLKTFRKALREGHMDDLLAGNFQPSQSIRQSPSRLRASGTRTAANPIEGDSDANVEFDHLMKSIRTGKHDKHGSSSPGNRRRSNSGNVEFTSDNDDSPSDSLGARPQEGFARSGQSVFRQSSLNQSGGLKQSSTAGGKNTVRDIRLSAMRARSASPNRFATTFSGMSGSGGRVAEEVNQLQQSVQTLTKELHAMRHSALQQSKLIASGNQNSHNTSNMFASAAAHQHMTAANVADLEKLDWRLALGEISMNLRRELADKASREELYSSLRGEIDALDKKISALQKGVDGASSAAETSRIENDLTSLRNKVSGELTGARFLWTSGHLVAEGWVPWDVQVVNAAPNIIAWKKGATAVKIRVPGLYRLCVSVFTTIPAILQIYLNEEPLFSFQPDTLDSQQASSGVPLGHKSDKYTLRRMRHSAGEVSSLCIDEHVSLPADSNLTVRYYAAAPAQAFFSIKKL